MVFTRIIFCFLFSDAAFPKGFFRSRRFQSSEPSPRKKSSAPIHEGKPALIKVPKNASSEPLTKASRISNPKRPLHTPNTPEKSAFVGNFLNSNRYHYYLDGEVKPFLQRRQWKIPH